MNDLIQLIGSYGFPIVCCLIMFYRDAKREDNALKQNQEIQKKHDEALSQMQTVVSENTLATQNLVTLITHFMNKWGGGSSE